MSRVTRAITWGLAGLALGATVGVLKVFGGVAGESSDPSQKARVLAETVSEGINWGVALLVAGVLVGVFWPVRRPPNPPAGGA